MKYKGYYRSFLSTLRNCGSVDLSDIYQSTGKRIKNSLLICGSDDPTIPISIVDKLRELTHHLQNIVITESGHYPHFEQPAQVSALITNFLEDRMKGGK
jgi:pimeloyl-ACP methyl ester carboxylesterase